MAVASMHLRVWSWSRQSPELQTECQNGKERWHGCWCQTGRSEYFTICSLTGIFTNRENGVNMEKHPVCSIQVGENAARCQRRMGRLIQADRRATLTEITTRYNR